MVNANQILGEEVFRTEDWRVIGEYVYDDEGGRHQAFYSPVKDVVIFGETIKAHERIQVEQSLKYSQAAATKLWNTAGLTEVDEWELDDEYGKSILGFVLYHHYPRFPGTRCFCSAQLLLLLANHTTPHAWLESSKHS